MQTKVLKAFVDKVTGTGYNAGSCFIGEADRIAELATGGYVVMKKPRKSAAQTETAVTGTEQKKATAKKGA